MPQSGRNVEFETAAGPFEHPWPCRKNGDDA